MSTTGMVATSQRAATKVGVDVLRAGGNAVDAAIAAAAALAVTEPVSTGLGGDCFALYYDAATKKLHALNGSGRAPAGLTRERFAERVHDNPLDANAVTVPGACAGWLDLLAAHGTWKRDRVLAPAIELAEHGYAVGDITAHYWQLNADRLGKLQRDISELTIEGRAPHSGETFRNPGMAKTLRTISNGGKDAFYRGEIAAAIEAVVQGAGGALTQADLAAHTSTWDEPISTTYRNVRVWECPPNGQGITALLALNILENIELAGLDPLGADRMHILIEAMRLAFADTRWYVADPHVTHVPVAELLAKDYAKARAALIDRTRATADVKRGSPVASSDTVYFCVVDGDGNACSFINSNYMGLGTGLVPKGFGFSLQNRGANFSSDPTHPNVVAPGKRPYHTIIPGMLTNLDGTLVGPFGVQGGFMQPQGHVQVVTAMIDDGVAPQAALDRARFSIEPVDGAQAILLEQDVPAATVAELERRGHKVKGGITGYERSAFGRGQIIRRDAGGHLTGGSDNRADGVVEST
ncbi:MAG TPA: gamma-glutamyltransferase [Kofleriaceae bacterium]|nr:gamma-glutamyltransferase [Kofleriaceae bacterium]